MRRAKNQNGPRRSKRTQKQSWRQRDYSPSPPKRRKFSKSEAQNDRSNNSDRSVSIPQRLTPNDRRRRVAASKSTTFAAGEREEMLRYPTPTLKATGVGSYAVAEYANIDTSCYNDLVMAIGPWAETVRYCPAVVRVVAKDGIEKCLLSVKYRDPFVLLSDDRLSALVHKGWSTILATHGCDVGKWYFEVQICKLSSCPMDASAESPNDGFVPDEDEYTTIMGNQSLYEEIGKADKSQKWRRDPHVRVGWSCRYGRYDLPIGHHAFSMALSDVDGAVSRNCAFEPYANRQLVPGDIIGCLINLNPPVRQLADPRKDLSLHCFLQVGLLCDSKRLPQPTCNGFGSFVEFTINGERYGAAVINLNDGVYHPAVSLYNGGCVRANFGPHFKHPLPDDEQAQAACYMKRPPFP